MEQKEIEMLIKRMIDLPSETEWIEFKCNNKNPDGIGKYISALSNSACLYNQDHGYLIFGIEDKTHKVVGTNFDPKKFKVGNENLELWLLKLLEPPVDFKILIGNYRSKKVVIFQIDATYSSPVRFKGQEYIRIGEDTRKLKEFPEKARKIWVDTQKYNFEKISALKNVDSGTITKLLNYPKYFRLLDTNLPEKKGIIEKLTQEKFINKEKMKEYYITNLGAILLANNLKDFDKLGRKSIRVIIYKGKNRLETIKEHEFIKGYATGFEGLVNYILDQLPTNEEIGRVFRTEVKMYPEIAIRELIANALIHQDFTITGAGPMVEIFEDRLEISNPGKPLIPTLRFIDHSPRSRNENLASFMRRINICEERGSGIDKVINSLEVYQLPPLEIREENNSLRIILYSHKPLTKMAKKEKIMACYQHCSLKFVSNELMTNESLRKRFNIEDQNYPMASKIIADTIKAKLIKCYDPNNKSKKYTKYIPIWV